MRPRFLKMMKYQMMPTVSIVYSSKVRGEKQNEMDLSKQKLPLHHAAITLSDLEFLRYDEANTCQNEASWSQVDRLKNDVLHLVASRCKPLTTKLLIWSLDLGSGVLSAWNRASYTTLEALHDHLETRRTEMDYETRTIGISDNFTGFAREAVDCLSLRRYSNIEDLPAIYRQRLTFVCTCGECLGGFVSPRMKMALTF